MKGRNIKIKETIYHGTPAPFRKVDLKVMIAEEAAKEADVIMMSWLKEETKIDV